ncbi:MAG TPA: bifunctional 2-C-methyl-D-erythritol 4-phosphate cytidylyltransferase/2-C-methyl-D-erythritol 2,4-cyclodiphosphate synthase [Epsilonproteobacteria bacterium]|nr:bifunctional 2-C-methyl-D-erythritol 4-phosphate cytidylyltransferase/2-C-methyl-D-erythritol 2,4-cyclodiphosphate synthase [Campylobacterota bacterium]
MKDITLILLGAGNSTRFGLPTKKQWLYIDDMPLWLFVANQYKCYDFDQIIIVGGIDEIEYMKKFAPYTYVAGGNSRQESLQNGLNIVNTPWVLVSDIARCCIDHETIKNILDAKDEADCIVPTLDVVDTLYLQGKPIDRENAKLIQTPQLSRTNLLKEAVSTKNIYTDDSSAMKDKGHEILFVKGSDKIHKLTTKNDLNKLTCLKPPKPYTFTGFGLDTHAFEENKTMVLGGVDIKSPFGFKAHSDGDVAIHAIIDALLGAAGMGDIGELFPDTDMAYHNANSKELLISVADKIYGCGFCITHIDITIVAQTPKIAPYKESIRDVLAKILKIAPYHINIKATTGENLGFIGRKEGVSVHAVANLTYFDWTRL